MVGSRSFSRWRRRRRRRNAVLLKIAELSVSHWRRNIRCTRLENPSVAMSSISVNSISWSLSHSRCSKFRRSSLSIAYGTVGCNWRHFIMIEKLPFDSRRLLAFPTTENGDDDERASKEKPSSNHDGKFTKAFKEKFFKSFLKNKCQSALWSWFIALYEWLERKNESKREKLCNLSKRRRKKTSQRDFTRENIFLGNIQYLHW